jgi:hypothetical protein
LTSEDKKKLEFISNPNKRKYKHIRLALALTILFLLLALLTSFAVACLARATACITISSIALLAIAYFEISSEILNLILTVAGGGGFIGLWTKGRSKLRSMMFERTYLQQIKEAKLDQIE